MGQTTNYRIDFDENMSDEDILALKKFVEDNFDVVNDSDECFIDFTDYNGYSFNIKKCFEEAKIKGQFTINVYEMERDPDYVYHFGVMED